MLVKETAVLRLFGLSRIPLLFFTTPRVIRLDDDGCEVGIALGYRTRNHLGSMYFGALCVGADCAGALNAFRTTKRHHPRVKVIFKDFQAQFLKRADGDVVFRCDQGRAIAEAVAKAAAGGERVTIPVEVLARVPDKYGDEPVARFTLGLSLKG
jgi:hypothetical protein